MHRTERPILLLLFLLIPSMASAQLPSTVIRGVAEEIAKAKAANARATLPAGETTFFGLFDEIPAGSTRRLRDAQLAAELSVRLGSAATTGPFVLAFSGKYLHQFENSFDDQGVMLPKTAGTTAIGQLKLTIPVSKGTGLKMPVSVTFANRTELIKEKEVRGNVGITYDLDSLFARFKP